MNPGLTLTRAVSKSQQKAVEGRRERRVVLRHQETHLTEQQYIECPDSLSDKLYCAAEPS